ncbi:hypothetical protein [Streptomyces oceani]|uniref:Uncharacterized protein n=1 Tax=Streptomyces oceani TaxID=1075402 RepID=A0A1E7KJD9_9ACTN|nr:hypothetical protein [Streptomyces oceani]OEV04078.1 hypothetical protein AN216_07480 [Streptomyces oceani]
MKGAATHPSVTAFDATAALCAVLNENAAEDQRIVSEMPLGERAAFAEQRGTLRPMLTDHFGNDIPAGLQ